MQTLSDVGIQFDREGNLSLDRAKLDDSLTTNLKDVIQLLKAIDTITEPIQPYKTGLYSSLDDFLFQIAK